MNGPSVPPGFFDLKRLAAYSSSSVRWLDARIHDRAHPLPHYRVEGKRLVKKDDFDQWMAQFRQDQPADELFERWLAQCQQEQPVDALEEMVNGVVARLARAARS